MIKQLRTILKTRISKKIISVVVTAITLSSVAFIIPELYIEKGRILKEVEVSANWITESVSDAYDNGTPPDNIGELFGGHQVMGYQICDASGCPHQSGEAITGTLPSPSDTAQSVLQENDTRLEVTLPITNKHGLETQITYRIDTAVMDKNYWIHLFTIMGQILGVSICAILTAMLTTNAIIIVPALKLKQQMMQAKQDPNNPTKYLLKADHDDEIADLIGEFNSLLHDIESYQNQLNQAKRDSDLRWKFAIEGSGDGIWDWNPITEEVFFSPQTIQNLGYEPEAFVHSMDAWQALIHPNERSRSIAALHAHMQSETTEFSVENRIRHHNGNWIWVLSRGMIVTRDDSGKPTRVVGTHTDITEQKRSEELIWSQANIDPLTNLPNRRMYNEKLSQLTDQSQETPTQLSLLFIDLDNFKSINDTHGHNVGDELLNATAQRLKDSVDNIHLVSRIGGDEFTVIVQGITDTKSLNAIGDKILSTLCKPFSIDSNVFYISASIGITRYPQDANDAETLTMNADQALYISKDNGRNRYTYFSMPMRTHAQQRLTTINELRIAILEEQFEVYYQPVIDYRTGLIVKAEALLRWQHPQRGIVSPAGIIEIAEDTGLIIEIGDFVFHRAIKQLAHWRNELHPNLEISINTSPVQYRDNGINVTEWLSFIRKKGVPCDAVVIEITESLVLDLSAPITDRLDAFRGCGIKIALDDFGTGYSSLSYLNKIRSDYLKVDYSFVKGILEASHKMELCQKIIDIAHIYNMKVIVEGVEQQGQDVLLKQASADYGQGFLYSRPVPAAEFEALLRKQNLASKQNIAIA